MLRQIHPAKAAGLLESLPPRERSAAWEMVDSERAGRILAHLHQEVRARLALEMDREDLITAARSLDLDDLVDLIQDLPTENGRELLRAMDLREREQLEAMLSYPEDSAGGLMNTDQISVRAGLRVGSVLRYLRLLEDLPDHTDKLMVVDRQNRYQGVLRVRRLLTSRPEQRVKQVMDTEFPAIPADLPSREVARRFEDLDLISAPVMDADGRLLGRITVDDVVDVIREESERSLMNMAGLDEEDDMFAPVLTSARRRAVWLGINLVTAFLAAWVIGLFEGTLEKVVALAVLMPIVASMGGIAGSQTLTLVIRGLALGTRGERQCHHPAVEGVRHRGAERADLGAGRRRPCHPLVRELGDWRHHRSCHPAQPAVRRPGGRGHSLDHAPLRHRPRAGRERNPDHCHGRGGLLRLPWPCHPGAAISPAGSA